MDIWPMTEKTAQDLRIWCFYLFALFFFFPDLDLFIPGF